MSGECRTCGYDKANHKREAHLFDPATTLAEEERALLVDAVLEASPLMPLSLVRVLVDVLTPVVDRIKRDAMAEALEAAYIEDRTTMGRMTPVERLTCFVVKMEDLVTRAAALRAVGSSDE